MDDQTDNNQEKLSAGIRQESVKLKILLVEDDAMIIDMYKMRLEAENYEVITVEKGSEALRVAKTAMPAVILLDVMLPESDGFSILQALKGEIETKNIPVLMLTNINENGDRERGMALGAIDYFVKSQHTPADVLVRIKRIIADGLHIIGNQKKQFIK
jgi:DNA-binding response OmpR family regulator